MLSPLEEKVIVEQPEEETHFVKHISEEVSHMHTGNFKFHNHYVVENIFARSYCFVCGIPTIGNTSCGSCKELYRL